MLRITEDEIRRRLALDNPWWRDDGGIDPLYRSYPRRLYFKAFCDLVQQRAVRRAVVLMGPRRVGKTVMIQQTVQHLIDNGAPRDGILYISLDTPVYTGLGLEQILHLWLGENLTRNGDTLRTVFFDEIQYLKDWERHLKSLVDTFPHFKFVASGSAAAALRLKSLESGAGRFTDFYLPGLAFIEYLDLIGIDRNKFAALLKEEKDPDAAMEIDIEDLNRHFVDYVNFGGLPEVALSAETRRGMERFVRSDILDKILLRDLPSLYGVDDTQDLNRLFSVLAYNTSQEVSLEGLAQSSGVAKNTLRKYLEYLEAAFLIVRLPRIGEGAERFRRQTHFKVHLAIPSLRAALFGPVGADDPAMPWVAESAVAAQLRQSATFGHWRYARWDRGEVDLVLIDPANQKPAAALEIKWSDRYVNRPEELTPLLAFFKRHPLDLAMCLTRSRTASTETDGVAIRHWPCALFCLNQGLTLEHSPHYTLNAPSFPEFLTP